jgi:hypothetical protein
MLNDCTLPEAKAGAWRAAEKLSKAGVHPYSVSAVGADDFKCLESCPPQYIASKFYAIVDVGDNPGRVELPGGIGCWEEDTLLNIRCGLLKDLSDTTRDRIAFWKWEEPTVWEAERIAWRKDKMATHPALEHDKQRRRADKYVSLKRTLDEIEGLLAPPPPAKKQRTDEEVLEERKHEGVALPDNDDDDI